MRNQSNRSRFVPPLMQRRNQNKKDLVMKFDPIPIEEQTKIVEQLKKEAASQSSFFRTLFHYLFIAISIIFFSCLIYTTFNPWGVKHSKHFKDIVPHWAFQVYYLISSYCFVVAAMLVKDPLHSTLISVARYSGYIMGIIVCLSWTHIFYKHSVTNPVLFWLPIADLLGLLLAQYVDFDSTGLIDYADNLDKYKYDYKTV